MEKCLKRKLWPLCSSPLSSASISKRADLCQVTLFFLCPIGKKPSFSCYYNPKDKRPMATWRWHKLGEGRLMGGPGGGLEPKVMERDWKDGAQGCFRWAWLQRWWGCFESELFWKPAVESSHEVGPQKLTAVASYFLWTDEIGRVQGGMAVDPTSYGQRDQSWCWLRALFILYLSPVLLTAISSYPLVSLPCSTSWQIAICFRNA